MINIPDKLQSRRVRSLRQREKLVHEILNVASPALATALVNAVMKGVQQNNHQAMRMAGEMIGMLKTHGMNIIGHQQNNSTTTTNTLALGDAEEKVSFDKICRQRDEDRRRRGIEAPGTVEVITSGS